MCFCDFSYFWSSKGFVLIDNSLNESSAHGQEIKMTFWMPHIAKSSSLRFDVENKAGDPYNKKPTFI